MATRKYRVTGRYEVGGAAPGETVELDPDVVNVDELVRVGLVEPLERMEPADDQDMNQETATAAPATEDPDLASGQATGPVKTERSGQTRSAKKATADDEPGEKAR